MDISGIVTDEKMGYPVIIKFQKGGMKMAEVDEVIVAMAEVGKTLAKAPWEIAKAAAKIAKAVATGGD